MRPYLPSPGSRSRSGAALLLSLLILLVLVAIVIQINVTTGTDARVARNDVGLTTMDLAVESALLQVEDQLLTDAGAAGAAAAGAEGAAGAAAGAAGAAPGGAPAAPGGAQEQAAATDSRQDEWARPQRTSINDIKLRVLVQDEDSKINVLNMLNPDEKEAEAAFDRVVRCLDLCRAGTRADIDTRTAEAMARAMLDSMTHRKDSKIPRPDLLSDDPAEEDLSLPRSLKEFSLVPPFDESHFRDFRDEDGEIVHSIGSFLTVWSSLATVGDVARTSGAAGAAGAGAANAGTGGNGNASPNGANGNTQGNGANTNGGAGGASGGAGGAAAAGGAGGSTRLETGGYAVNVNTAPVAVLKALFDDRDLPPRFWDRLVEYRNLEEEKADEESASAEEVEPPLDEFGEEILERRIFDNLAELSEVEGFTDLPAEVQAKLNQLLTVESRVFSIFVIARRSTAAEGDMSDSFGSREEMEASEQSGNSLLRVVRCVVWRHKQDDEFEIVPIVRWEVLDYVPFEVQDYPDEDR